MGFFRFLVDVCDFGLDYWDACWILVISDWVSEIAAGCLRSRIGIWGCMVDVCDFGLDLVDFCWIVIFSAWMFYFTGRSV